MNNGQMMLVPEWFQWLHGWVQSKEAIEINDLIWLDGNCGPQTVVVTFAMRHNDVKAISGTTLENHNELFAFRPGRGRLGQNGTRKEGGDGGGAYDGHCAIFHEDSPCDGHEDGS